MVMSKARTVRRVRAWERGLPEDSHGTLNQESPGRGAASEPSLWTQGSSPLGICPWHRARLCGKEFLPAKVAVNGQLQPQKRTAARDSTASNPASPESTRQKCSRGCCEGGIRGEET